MHKCSTALVHCMDFRLGSAIRDYLNENELYDDCDIISLAGAAKDLNDENSDVLMTQLTLSKNLHGIDTVILMHHTDCGGYGGRDAFENAEEEWQHHNSEMQKAKATILTEMPDLKVKLVLADLKEDGSIEFNEIN